MFVACEIWCFADVSSVSLSSEQTNLRNFMLITLYAHLASLDRIKVILLLLCTFREGLCSCFIRFKSYLCIVRKWCATVSIPTCMPSAC